MCGSWGHSYHKEAGALDRDYSLVKKLHSHKILESEEIVVVSDSSGYYGDSTTEEIAFARYRNIPILYFDGEIFSGWEIVERSPNRYADASLIDSFRASLDKMRERIDASQSGRLITQKIWN
jgi:hypothetical protein